MTIVFKKTTFHVYIILLFHEISNASNQEQSVRDHSPQFGKAGVASRIGYASGTPAMKNITMRLTGSRLCLTPSNPLCHAR
jgi:hypothetical protein